MHCDSADAGIGAPAGNKGCIDGAIGVQASDARANDIVDGYKISADEHFAVRLHGHGIDDAVGTQARIEKGVQRSVSVQNCQIRARHTIEGGERAADDGLVVRQERDRINWIISACAGIEGVVEGAIAVETGDGVAIGAVDAGEQAADDELAIILESHGTHWPVRTLGGVEDGVEGAIRIDSRQAVPGAMVERVEVAADEQFAVRLQRHGKDGVIGAIAGVESGVARTGGSIGRLVIDNGESGPAGITQGDINGIGQNQENGLIAFTETIGDQANRDGLAGLAGQELKGAIGGPIIGASPGGAIDDEIIDGACAGDAAGASHRNGDIGAVFLGFIIGLTEGNRSVSVVIENGQDRETSSADSAVGRGGEQAQVDRERPFHQGIVD